jgi:hypothetical protein
MVLDENGTLRINGDVVLGEGGPITLPEYTNIAIGSDGTISIQAPRHHHHAGDRQAALVKAEASELTKNTRACWCARRQPAGHRPHRGAAPATWKAAMSRRWRKWCHDEPEPRLRNADEAVLGHRFDDPSRQPPD